VQLLPTYSSLLRHTLSNLIPIGLDIVHNLKHLLGACAFAALLSACGVESTGSAPINGNVAPNSTAETASQTPVSHEVTTRRFESHPFVQQAITQGDQIDFRSNNANSIRAFLAGRTIATSTSTSDFFENQVSVQTSNDLYAFCDGGRTLLASSQDSTFVDANVSSDSSGFFNSFNEADERSTGYWDIASISTTLDNGQRANFDAVLFMIDVADFPEVVSQNLPYPAPGQQDVLTGAAILTAQQEALVIVPSTMLAISSISNAGASFFSTAEAVFPFGVADATICGI